MWFAVFCAGVASSRMTDHAVAEAFPIRAGAGDPASRSGRETATTCQAQSDSPEVPLLEGESGEGELAATTRLLDALETGFPHLLRTVALGAMRRRFDTAHPRLRTGKMLEGVS